MDVLAHRGALGHRGDHRLAEVLRVRAREADPLDPVDGVAGAQQLAELGAEVRARGRAPTSSRSGRAASARARRRAASRVTSATISPGRRLTSRPRTDGTMQYAQLRVAAHRHLHPRLERAARGARAARRRTSAPRSRTGRGRRRRRPTPTQSAEMRDRARPERDVHVRIELEDPLPLGLGVAAADGDHALRLGLLERPRLRQVRGEPLVGLLPDRARVEDDRRPPRPGTPPRRGRATRASP